MQRAKEKYFATKEGKFQAGNPTTGQPATAPGPEWMNAVQEELCGVIEAAGITLDDNNNGQLKSAIEKMLSNVSSSLTKVINNVSSGLTETINQVKSSKEDTIETVTFFVDDDATQPPPRLTWQYKDRWAVGQVKRVIMTNAERNGTAIPVSAENDSIFNVTFYRNCYREFRCIGERAIGGIQYAILQINGNFN